MEDKENSQRKRYTRRTREKSEKGKEAEKEALEKRRKKKLKCTVKTKPPACSNGNEIPAIIQKEPEVVEMSSVSNRNGTPIEAEIVGKKSTVNSGNEIPVIDDQEEPEIVCKECNQSLHNHDSVNSVTGEQYYCEECARKLPWDAVDDFEFGVPRNAKLWRSAAQIEKNRLRALHILETKRQLNCESKAQLTPKQQEEELNQRNEDLLTQLQELELQCTPLTATQVSP